MISNKLKRIIQICFYLLLIVSCQQKSKLQIEEENFRQKVQAEIERTEADNINQSVINQNVYLGTDSLKSMDLKDFINSSKLFLYFSSNTCSPCIDQTVETLEEIFPYYNQNENIVFVSPDYPARYRNNCYGKKLLMLEKGKFGLPLENKTEPPFFVIIDSSLKVISIHVVNKMDFNRTEKYLKDISKSIIF